MVEADDYLGGVPVQHRQVQGFESDKFKGYFEALSYLDGGIESGFNHVEPTPENPFLFQVRGDKKKINLTQVPLSKSSLNEGDSFILKADKARVWCWNGKDARPLEKARANAWAENMCTMGTVVVLDQGDGDDEVKEFWDYLGDGTIAPKEDAEPAIAEFAPLLYRVDGDPSKELTKVAEGSPIAKTSKVVPSLKKSDLDSGDVFLVDNGWEIFIWIGKGADLSEKVAAMGAADRYAKIAPRALNLPVEIVKEGSETDNFNAYFE